MMNYDTTFEGLHKWTQAMFEKLGWMVLAHAYGRDYKVTAYKKSLSHLQKAIAEKLKSTKDEDRLEDLKILQQHVKILSAHAAKDFKK